MHTSRTHHINGLNFHYLEWLGTEPPAIFLPGFISNAYAASRLAQAVERRVLAFDLRGRGRSDKPETGYGIPQHVEDLRLRLADLELEKVALMGHSYGATLAITFAHRYPESVERLVLFDGGAVSAEPAFQLFMAYHQNLTYTYPSAEAYVQQYRDLPTLQPWTEEAEILVRSNIIEQADGSAVRAVPRHVVEAELAAISLAEWQRLQDYYPHIHVPVLLIRAGMGSFGREDQHLSDTALQPLLDGIPNIEVFEMPDTGHTGVLTVPDDDRDAKLREFLG